MPSDYGLIDANTGTWLRDATHAEAVLCDWLGGEFRLADYPGVRLVIHDYTADDAERPEDDYEAHVEEQEMSRREERW